jgi:hypothetical protein
MKMGTVEGAALFSEAGNLGAREVDRPIAGHQQPNRLQLTHVSRETPPLIDEFIGEIFDGVPQDLQSVTRFRIYPSFMVSPHLII